MSKSLLHMSLRKIYPRYIYWVNDLIFIIVILDYNVKSAIMKLINNDY